MSLPPLRDPLSPASGPRAKTAPAGTPGSGRRGQAGRRSHGGTPRTPSYASPSTTDKPLEQRPVTAQQLSEAAVSWPPSPPGTAKSSSFNRTWQNFAPPGQTDVMEMVHRYWAPVEDAVRTRHPGKLEVALREMHGSQYLRTIYSVRRSTGLKASERHAVEMELAARLVRARAVLGKWQAALREIYEARQSRNTERLEKLLAKWTFAEEDEMIALARDDLERWHDLALTMPSVLKDAVEKNDVSQLRRAVDQLNVNGPNGVEGSSGARKILSRYDLQVKTLGDAVHLGRPKAIKAALEAWMFDDEDPHIEAGERALEQYDEQKAVLRAALDSKDGARLQKALEEWRFEKDAPEYLEARAALNRYVTSCGHVSALAQMPGSLPQLFEALKQWEFAADDAVVLNAQGVIDAYEESIRKALRAEDGWQLERQWGSGRVVKALFSGEGNLYEEGLAFLHRYAGSVEELRYALRKAEDLDADMAPAIRSLVEEWDFALNDPSLEACRSWLQFHEAVHRRNAAALHGVTQAGDIFTLRQLLPYARRKMEKSCVELRNAEDACDHYEEAVGFIGAVALGVEPQQLQGALDRSSKLDKCMRSIRANVESLDVKWISGLKATTKPPGIVHAVFQMIVHLLAGISPGVRDPPRETDWRSCQKMFSNTQAFFSSLMDVPDSIAAGKTGGIQRARTIAFSFQVQYEEQWSAHGIAPFNECAGVLFDYLVHVFSYADLIEATSPGPRGASAMSLNGIGNQQQGPATSSRHIPNEPDSSLLPAEVVPGSEPQSPSSVHREAALRQGRRASLEIIATREQALGNVLQGARYSLCRNKVLAMVWVLAGQDPTEVDRCMDRARRYVASTQAAAVVAAQMVAHLLPMGRLLSAGDSTLRLLTADSSRIPSAGNSLSLTGKLGGGQSQFEESFTSVEGEDDAVRVTFLTVKLMSGDVVANLQIDSSATVTELKQRLASIEGTPASLQRLLYDGQTLLDFADLQMVASGSTVTLIRLAPTLPQLVDSAAQSVQSSGVDAFAQSVRPSTSGSVVRPSTSGSVSSHMPQVRPSTSGSASVHMAPQDHYPSDAASYLISGPQGEKLSSRPRRGTVQPEILKLLRATKKAMHITPEDPCAGPDPLGEFFDFKLRAEPLALDHEVIEASHIPLMNLALAKRVISAGEALPAMDEFVGAMAVYFQDFVPLRAAWTHAIILAEEAQRALTQSQEIATFAALVEGLEKPRCTNADDVKAVAELAMSKVQQLSRHGISLPAIYVEHVRQAIDDAGVDLLANAPSADPGARIEWAEAAMAIQLAAVPQFCSTLRGIAERLAVEEVQRLASSTPSKECVRLIAAVIWAIQPECRSNPGSVEVKQMLSDPTQFVESLQAWSPIRDASVPRISRSQDLLLGIWGWAADGCDGSPTLGSLFAWVSLLVAFLPIADMAQRLTPVYKAVRQGMARSERAPANQKRLAQSKAWSSTLFLLDGPGEQWWWLRLIRPAAHMDLPWADGEDGGVSELRQGEDEEHNAGQEAEGFKRQESAQVQNDEHEAIYSLNPEDELDNLSGEDFTEFMDPVLDADIRPEELVGRGGSADGVAADTLKSLRSPQERPFSGESGISRASQGSKASEAQR